VEGLQEGDFYFFWKHLESWVLEGVLQFRVEDRENRKFSTPTVFFPRYCCVKYDVGYCY
jgi:hypothetical protein